jgi:hypothetical protein
MKTKIESQKKFIVLNGAGNAMQLHSSPNPTSFIVKMQNWKYASRFESVELAIEKMPIDKNGKKRGRVVDVITMAIVAENALMFQAPKNQLFPICNF